MKMPKVQPQKIRDASSSGIDITLIDRLLALTPAQRIQLLVKEARNLAALDARLRQ